MPKDNMTATCLHCGRGFRLDAKQKPGELAFFDKTSSTSSTMGLKEWASEARLCAKCCMK